MDITIAMLKDDRKGHGMKKITLCCWVPLWLVIGSAQADPGEYWELTTSMEGMGMSMPGETSRECMPIKDDGEPVGVDKDCSVSDIKRIPNGATYNFACKDGSTGSGKQTRTKDTLSSEMQANTKDGSMKMSVKGKRIGGNCETDAKYKAAMAEGQKSCDLSNREFYKNEKEAAAAATSYETYYKKGAFCASKKDQACALLKRELPNDLGVYGSYAAQGAEQQSGTAKACGLGSADSIRASVCKNNANNRAEMNRLEAHCPSEAKVLRAKIREEECSGRQFTSPGDKAKCLAGADVNSSGDSSTSAGPPSSGQGNSSNPAEAGKNAVETGKKALKGLKDAFGF